MTRQSIKDVNRAVDAYIRKTELFSQQLLSVNVTRTSRRAVLIKNTMPTQGLLPTSSPSSGLRTAQVIGLTTTAFLCGRTFSLSFSTTPALLQAPAPLLARQWKRMFDGEKALAPAVVAGASCIFGYLSSRGKTAYETNWINTVSERLNAMQKSQTPDPSCSTLLPPLSCFPVYRTPTLSSSHSIGD